MKHLAASTLVLALALAPFAPAQTTVTDTFSSSSGYWEPDVTSGSGTFGVAAGVLNFTHGGLSTGASNSASRDWTNSVSAAANWSARVDLTLNNSLVVGQVTRWAFFAAALNQPTPNDYLSVEIVHSYMQTPYRILNANLYTDGTAGAFAQVGSLTAPTISLLFAYTAATGTLTLSYDGDNNPAADNFTVLTTCQTGATWSVGASDQFGLRLSAEDLANAFPAPALGQGFFSADNFSVTTAAVPEPASVAMLFGMVALLAAVRRRRGSDPVA